MNTRAFVSAITSVRGVAVSSLGRTSEELFALCADRTLFLDAMGAVVPVALGIAVAAPKVDIVAVDTDGSFLMNLSILPVLGAWLPATPNLRVVIVDNGMYESGGGLPSRLCRLDWVTMFRGVGLEASVVLTAAAAHAAVSGGVQVVVGEIVDDEPLGRPRKVTDGVASSYTVEAWLAAATGRPQRLPAEKP